MIHITPYVYAQLANSIIDGDGMNVQESYELGDITYEVWLESYFHRHTELNNSTGTIVSAIHPIKWEVRTFKGDKEIPNDFSEAELKYYLN